MQRLLHLSVYAFQRARAAVTAFLRSRNRSPYGHVPVQVQVVVGVDGTRIADTATALAYVSRHGLSRAGVFCPACGAQAAKPNQWRKVRQTKWGEAVQCSCGKVLLASPDDDIDPVKPDSQYDEAIYHSFHKPPTWSPPLPRLRSKLPQVEDWVYIMQGLSMVLLGHERTPGGMQDVRGCEGRVVERDALGVLLVALAGNTGLGGQQGIGGAYAHVPEESAFVMITDAIRPGNLVRVVKGPHEGRTGVVIDLPGRAQVALNLAPTSDLPAIRHQAIVEHIEVVVPDEIDVDAIPFGSVPTRPNQTQGTSNV